MKKETINKIVWLFIFISSFMIFNAKLVIKKSGDTVPAELLPISIIKEGNLDFNEFITNKNELPYWFRNINNRIISFYPIIPGILNLPVYLIAHFLDFDLYTNRLLLSHISASLIASLSVVFMFLLLKTISGKETEALFFTFIYACATCVLSIASQEMWQHGPSLLFIIIAMYFIFTEKNKLIPYAGFFVSLAVLTRPANFIIAAFIVLFVVLKHKRAIPRFILYGLIPTAFVSLYSIYYWQSLLALGQGHTLVAFNGSLFKGLAGLLISPSRGLLLYSPIFIFSLAYMPYLYLTHRNKPFIKYLAVAFIVNLLLYSKWDMWWGGHCFAYRLLIETIPILIILLMLFWQHIAVRFRSIRVFFMDF